MGNVLGVAPAAWGGIFTVFAAVFLFLGIFKRTRAVLIFLGICLLGSGLLSRLLVSMARIASNLTDSLFGKLFGVAVPGIIVLIAGVILIHNLHPKGGGASRRTFWLAAFVAACLIAGVSQIAALNGIPADVHTSVSTVTGG